MMLTRLAPILIVVFGFGIGTHADAVVLCAKPRSDGTYNTSVKIREACKAGETQLNAAQLGVQGEQGPPGPQGEEGPAGPEGQAAPSLVVADVEGSVVGYTLGAQHDSPNGISRLLVVRKIDDTLVQFELQGPTLSGSTASDYRFYESTDCSGVGYIYQAPDRMMPRGVVAGLPGGGPTDRALYYPAGPTSTRLVRSIEMSGIPMCAEQGGLPTSATTCCWSEGTSVASGEGIPGTHTVAPYGMVDLTSFVLPWSVQQH